MLNPIVRFSAGTLTSREGCVSVPDFTANVTRAEHIVVDYVDYGGMSQSLEASGFEAVALQHEIDHLDGKLFLDRVTSADIFRRKSYGK
jgi:peptide deformylase